MKNINVVTISLDVTIDEEKAILIDSIMSKFDEAGREVSAQRVIEMAFNYFGSNCSTLTDVLRFMDKKLEKDLEKRCKNEGSEISENQQTQD